MHWPIASLDPGIRANLAAIGRRRGLETGASCFQSTDRRNALLVCALFAVPATGGGAVLLWVAISDGSSLLGTLVVAALLLLLTTWTFLLLLERIRAAQSDVAPFRLLTPKVLIQADYAHGWFDARLLRDATKFSSADQFESGSQKFSARVHQFTFPEGLSTFTVKTPQDIALVDAILQQAREGTAEGAAGADLVPPSGGSAKPAGWRSFTNPFGEFWMAALAFLIIGFIVVYVLARIFGK